MDMGWVLGLTHGLGWVRIFQFVMGWVGLGPGYENWRMLFTCYWCILIYCNSKQTQPRDSISIHSPSCVTVHPPPSLRTTPSAVSRQKRAGHLQRYESASCFWWAAELLGRTVQQLPSPLTSSPSCAGHFGQFCAIWEGLFVCGSHPHKPKNKIVGEQSGSCQTFTLRTDMQAHV